MILKRNLYLEQPYKPIQLKTGEQNENTYFPHAHSKFNPR